MNKGINIIKEYEGCELKAYKCPAGVWTIGYGHTAGVTSGMSITQLQAEQLLADDLPKYEAELKRLLRVQLSDNQFGALTSFIYNFGAANLGNSKLLRLINANPSDPAIPSEFRKWVRAKGEILPGLVKRREEEIKLYYSK